MYLYSGNKIPGILYSLAVLMTEFSNSCYCLFRYLPLLL